MLLHFSDYKFLSESSKKVAIIAFGRMNPPTVGHKKLMKKMIDEAKKRGGEAMLFLSHSQDRKKNPLSYEDKLRFVRSDAPKALRVMDSPARTIYEVVDVLCRQGYEDFVVVCGSDRVADFQRIENYKEKFGFSSLEVVSSGERDADSDDLGSSISASRMREYAKEGDFEAFSKGAGCSRALVEDMYEAVRRGLGI